MLMMGGLPSEDGAMFETIIFATDLSPEWDEIVACAGQFRDLGCSRAVLTHVVKGKSSPGAPVKPSPEVSARIEQQKRQLLAAGLEVLVETPSGFSDTSINEMASRHGASLIVVGTHGKSVLREVVLGSFSNALLHRSRIPILLINMKRLRSGGRDGSCQLHCSELLRHCLFPTDLFCTGEGACKFIGHLCSKGLSRVTLLHSAEFPDFIPKAFLEWFETTAKDCLKKIEMRLSESGIAHVHTHISKGRPGSTILNWLESGDISLVIMETHGKGLLSEVVQGSVAYDVSRLAPCPVLLVPLEGTTGRQG